MTQFGGDPGQALDRAGAPLGAIDDTSLTTHELVDLELAPDGAVVADGGLSEVGPTRSLRSDAWRRFRRNRLALAGLAMVAVLLVLAVLGPLFVGSPTDQSPIPLEKPTNQHPFGTDRLGHDVLAQIVHGIRLSLFIAFLVVIIETVIGLAAGATAGWFGGVVDSVFMRIVDIILGIPYLVLALVLISVLGEGVIAVIVTLAATAWLQTTRTVRAGFLQVRDLEYVEAARAVGVPARRIVWRHILPNVFQPVVVLMAVGVGSAILAEAALSFLGVGVQPPDPSLGRMISESASSFTRAPHLLLFPGGAIVATVLGFLLVGDGLRDALDVKDA